MTLKRQLLLVSLLTLMLPWAGCEFIRETETALRQSQQAMLGGLARAVADSLASYPEAFPVGMGAGENPSDQLYGHPLDSEPSVDGYFDDWPLERDALVDLRGTDGPVRFALGVTEQFLFVYVEVRDRTVVYADARSILPTAARRFADRVTLKSVSPPYLDESLTVAAEAPGPVAAFLESATGVVGEPTVRAYWQDVPGGYQVEMRVPLNLLGTHLGIEVENTSDATVPGVRSRSFAGRFPGRLVALAPELAARASEASCRAGSGSPTPPSSNRATSRRTQNPPRAGGRRSRISRKASTAVHGRRCFAARPTGGPSSPSRNRSCSMATCSVSSCCSRERTRS